MLRRIITPHSQSSSPKFALYTTNAAGITVLNKVLYTANAHTTGGRDGRSKTDDGRLDVVMSAPGSNGPGTNPEQLFAAGYSACFIGAMRAVSAKEKIKFPEATSVDAQVALGTTDKGYGLAVKLQVTVPDLERSQAERLVDGAHAVCPYSNATRGNIQVDISLK